MSVLIASSSRAELLDVLGREVGVLLDVGDCHVSLLDLDGAVAGCRGDAGLNSVALAVLGSRTGNRGRARIPVAARRFGRCPSGSRTASGCRPSRRPPAARWRRPTSIGLVRDGEGDGAALAALVGAGDDEALHVQVVLGHARVGPDLLDRVEHRGRPARPGRSLLPVRDDAVEFGSKSRWPIVVGQLQVQPVAGLVRRASSLQLVVKDHVLRRRAPSGCARRRTS